MNKTRQKLTALCERGLYERQCLNNQLLAMAGSQPTADTLRHQVTALLWHSKKIEGYFKMILNEVQAVSDNPYPILDSLDSKAVLSGVRNDETH